MFYGRDTIYEEGESSGCFRPEESARSVPSDESDNPEVASPVEEYLNPEYLKKSGYN